MHTLRYPFRKLMNNQSNFKGDFDLLKRKAIEESLKEFPSIENGRISLRSTNLREILRLVLTDDEGKPADVSDEMSNELFALFDSDCDRKLDDSEFENFLHQFVKPLTKPVTALLVIDMQNDFIDGSLALKSCPANLDANRVIPVINNLVENSKFDVVAYTIDDHPPNHISFFENLKLRKLSKGSKQVEEISLFDAVSFEGEACEEQKLWPVHCVQGTWGCELHKDLLVKEDSLIVHKGQNPDVDSYSAFCDNSKLSCTALPDELRKRNVTHVFVCGVAFDYCVAFSAEDALSFGYPTVIIEDGTVGTDVDNMKCMKEKLIRHNCVFSDSKQVDSLITGKTRRVEFAYTLLEKLKNTCS